MTTSYATAPPTIRDTLAAIRDEGGPRLVRLNRRSSDSHGSRYFDLDVTREAVEVYADDEALRDFLPGFRDLARDVPGLASVEVRL